MFQPWLLSLFYKRGDHIRIKIITKGNEKNFEISGNPVILETMTGRKKHIYTINPTGSISKIRGKRNLNIIEMLESRSVGVKA